jgi:SPP1 family predicted phage head-tail adaptor
MNLNGFPTNPGELRTLITLESSSIEKDAGGAQKPIWSKLDDVYAKWSNIHGQEVWVSQAVQAQEPATVFIRYRADVTTQISILKDGKRYQIFSIDDIRDRHEYMELKVLLVEGSV